MTRTIVNLSVDAKNVIGLLDKMADESNEMIPQEAIEEGAAIVRDEAKEIARSKSLERTGAGIEGIQIGDVKDGESGPKIALGQTIETYYMLYFEIGSPKHEIKPYITEALKKKRSEALSKIAEIARNKLEKL